MSMTKFVWATSMGLALALAFVPETSEAACDIGECNPQVCDTWRPAWTINDFPAHQTDTTPDQRSLVGKIAQHVADSQDDPDPIVCLRLIGHASSFRGISADEYDRRGQVRGETVAEMLTNTLETHGLKAFTVDRDDIDNDDAFCGEVLGSDITLIIDGRGNACPLVDNMVNSSSSAARSNRAINRRVAIYALRDEAPIETIDLSPAEVCESFPDALCADIPDVMIEGRVCSGTLFGISKAELRARIEVGTATHRCGPLE